MEHFETVKAKDQKDKISCQKLDEYFASLEPVEIAEMIGKWQGGYFPTGKSWLEIFLKDFIVCKWYGKTFLTNDKVKALIFTFLGIKFNIPGGTAILRKVEFRDKISAAMIYNYLPIIDNFRKIDNNTVMGIMEVKGRISLYFYLKRQ